MNEAIAGLIRLQEMDIDLNAVHIRVNRVSPRRAEIAARRAGVVAAQEESKKALVSAQLNRKNKEIEIDVKDAAVRKHSSELNNVKSNDAYRALVSEIEAAKKEKALLEDQVLVLMEEIESLQKAAKASEVESQTEKVALDGLDRALDAEEAEIKAAAEAKKVERDAFFAGLPEGVRSRYEAVQRGRPGFVVVVPINAMVCGGCRTGLTPNLVNQVMKGKEIVSCDGCSRILYIIPKPVEPVVPVPPAGVVAPEPPSVAPADSVSSPPPVTPT